MFDKEGNGFIGQGELKYVLTSLGEKLSEEEVDELLKGVQVTPCVPSPRCAVRRRPDETAAAARATSTTCRSSTRSSARCVLSSSSSPLSPVSLSR